MEDNNDLTKPFTEEEVMKTVFSKTIHLLGLMVLELLSTRNVGKQSRGS